MLAFRPIFPVQNAPFSRLSHPVAPISHALISLTQGAYLRSDGTFGDTSTESLADSTAPIPSAASRYSGASGSASDFAEALLRGGSLSQPRLAEGRFSTMVRAIEPLRTVGGESNGWRLSDGKGESLGEFDWLLLCSASAAHPRWTRTFGGEPPLSRESASLLGDTQLEAALHALGNTPSAPVISCLMAFDADAAAAWAALPCATGGAGGAFAGCELEADATISRLLVQPLPNGLTSVVLHSTLDFARAHLDVYGATSAAARVGGAATDATREQEIVDRLRAALSARLAPKWLQEEDLASPVWGPHLHRWGAAFPQPPFMDQSLAVCAQSRIAFCGDYVAGPHAASVEGAVMAAIAGATESSKHLAAMARCPEAPAEEKE